MGICGYALQSPNTCERGIGRYASGFIKSLVHASPADEFVVYLRGTPVDPNPLESFLASHPNASVRRIAESPVNRAGTLNVLRGNEDRLDWLVLTSPQESHVTDRGKIPRVATVVYDLIPKRMRGLFLDPPEMKSYREAFENYLDAARKYDRLLAISNATRSDFINEPGFKEEQVITIGCGVEPRFKPRGLRWEYPAWLAEILGERPYVLHVGGMDPRKGGEDLLHAWAMLPMRVKTKHKLVYAYEIDGPYSFNMRKLASLNNVGFQLELLGRVSDERLVDLYQNARVMCLPSSCEGLGLPIIESQACGVPVIAGDNTGQVEAVGDGGQLVRAGDRAQLSSCLEKFLEDTVLRDRLGQRALAHSREFSWSSVATRTRVAIGLEPPQATPEEVKIGIPAFTSLLTKKRPSIEVLSDEKPPLAFFGLPPCIMSGVTPIGLVLAEALANHYQVTFYHDPALKPAAVNAKGAWARPFARVLPVDAYDGCRQRVFQFGNSHYHAWQINMIHRRGGVVTLHDACMSGLWEWLARNGQGPGGLDWPDLLRKCDPSLTRFVVHSRAANAILAAAGCKTGRVILPPARVNPASADREATRERLKLPRKHDASLKLFLLGCGGIVHPIKLPQTVLAAYRIARGRCERDGILLVLAMIGLEGDGGATHQVADEWGLPDVHWTGKLEHREFADAMACLDAAIQLRDPPTNGEMSGALLDAMRAGVPAIVSNVGSFAEVPDDAVLKVTPTAFFLSDVVRAVTRLAVDEPARAKIAAAALAHVKENHDPPEIAAAYVDQIEQLEASSSLGSRIEFA